MPSRFTGRFWQRIPRMRTALHLLGVIVGGYGRLDASVDLIRRAIASNPKVAGYHYNLGNTLFQQNHFDLAISAYENALRLKPDFADAWFNLGNTLLMTRQD